LTSSSITLYGFLHRESAADLDDIAGRVNALMANFDASTLRDGQHAPMSNQPLSCLINAAADRAAVPAPADDASAFHMALLDYAPTPLRDLPALAAELGVAAVSLKDESHRFGLPAFKVLGASWAIELALRENPRVTTLIAASAGNHGRAVAHIAARRGLACRVFLPARAAVARRDAIAAEGAEIVVVDGDYEDAVAQAGLAGTQSGAIEIADVGDSGPAHWVIDGYATLFTEADAQGDHDLIIVPVGVGSLAAAAARHVARRGSRLIGAEPVNAACLTASLAAGEPTRVPTPGTTMAGLDCAEVSSAAWPSLRAGIHGMVTVSDARVAAAMRELATAGFAIGESGAAPLAALRALAADPACLGLRAAVKLDRDSRVMLIATEGPTDPETYRRALAS
jgi:diaminopropionate ammonia-lyase